MVLRARVLRARLAVTIVGRTARHAELAGGVPAWVREWYSPRRYFRLRRRGTGGPRRLGDVGGE